jgi:hypothetical protein
LKNNEAAMYIKTVPSSCRDGFYLPKKFLSKNRRINLRIRFLELSASVKSGALCKKNRFSPP